MLIRLLGGKTGGRDIEVDQNRILCKPLIKFDGEFFLYKNTSCNATKDSFMVPVFERIEPPFEINNGSVGVTAKGD